MYRKLQNKANLIKLWSQIVCVGKITQGIKSVISLISRAIKNEKNITIKSSGIFIIDNNISYFFMRRKFRISIVYLIFYFFYFQLQIQFFLLKLLLIICLTNYYERYIKTY